MVYERRRQVLGGPVSFPLGGLWGSQPKTTPLGPVTRFCTGSEGVGGRGGDGVIRYGLYTSYPCDLLPDGGCPCGRDKSTPGFSSGN